jgi:hypothetical protein
MTVYYIASLWCLFILRLWQVESSPLVHCAFCCHIVSFCFPVYTQWNSWKGGRGLCVFGSVSFARRRVGGQRSNCGLRSHPVGMFRSVMRWIIASFLAVHCHICLPSTHSIILCNSVSSESQCRHLVVEDSRILCNLTLVGIKSWITAYRVIFMASWVGLMCSV